MPFPTLTQFVSVASLLISLTVPPAVEAKTASNDSCVRFLQAELPAKLTIAQADCDQLARAIFRATLVHQQDAPVIFWAALTGGFDRGAGRLENERPCGCVIHLFRASLAAAPTRASAILEIAIALYPDCADALATRLNEFINAYSQGTGSLDFGDSPMQERMSDPGDPGSPGVSVNASTGGLALPQPPAETSVVNG